MPGLYVQSKFREFFSLFIFFIVSIAATGNMASPTAIAPPDAVMAMAENSRFRDYKL